MYIIEIVVTCTLLKCYKIVNANKCEFHNEKDDVIPVYIVSNGKYPTAINIKT